MAWWYIGGQKEEPEEVRFPMLINLGYSSMKAFQMGATAGLIGGAMLSMRRGKFVTKATFFQDTTLTMRNVTFISAGVLGPLHAASLMATHTAEERQLRAFGIHNSTWMNRIDSFTAYGMVAGHLFWRPDLLYGLFGISAGYAVPLGGIVWGGLTALAFDVPLSILLPNYWCHNEDVDFYGLDE